MRLLLLLFFSLFISSPAFSQENLRHPFFDLQKSTAALVTKNNSLKNGEYLEYDIHWGITKVGSAFLFADGIVIINGRNAMHILSQAKSSSFIDKIFKVKDRNDSWFDTETLNSYGYYKEINEGRYFKNEWSIFDLEKGIYHGKKMNKKKVISSFEGLLEFPVSDILSAMYKVRGLPLKKGDDFTIDVNTKKNWRMAVRVVRTEKINTILGKKKCLVGEPLVGDEGLFVSKKGKRMFVWLTDDEDRIPVLLKAEVFLGSVTATLTERTLRYQ